ncbi:DedA family protein [Alicyclobacillus ferrooxydans]|uniref:Alkaline phosphatase n=1 Tax=Alicyclobacillus ferrooxydans TaxID=471514 RepID=A0A0P9CZK0_9BACL|nr:DedA family protein [Alicyclobacillus ferrooxydans]KPV45144.1 alkaline phosphatase [Alicyclobacillus ferrooxydans]
MSAHLTTFVSHYGLLAIFILMTLESACIPIPSEVVVPLAGYLAFQHSIPFWAGLVVTIAANVFGGWIAYLVGSTGGRAFIRRYGRYILLNPHHLERADAWFARRGEVTVFVARLLPAFRTFISLPAGVARMPLGRFLTYSFLGSIPWNLVLMIAGYQLGAHWSTIDKHVKPITDIGIVLFVIAVLWFWFARRRADSKQSSTNK